ncbi:lysophospholipid acyltransferase family protein [Bosea sp. TAF32]|uniref:lysophospholipid acyltransferase family protein n=1 Tax=Bosea sp. TAF32 TaxID=3237482 RepID=UPI003F93034D
MQAVERVLHHALRRLPISFVSNLGARLAWLKIRFIDPDVARKARANIRHHFPAMPEAEADKLAWRFVENVGRLMAEFSIVHRFAAAERMELVGADVARADIGKIPTIALCLHLGNWEVLASALQIMGVPIASISEIPDNAAHRDIAEATRSSFNVNVLPPDRNGALRALSILKGNGVLAIFPDEKRKGTMMAPLFGRQPHLKGNLALVAKLARRTGAQIVVAYCERVGETRFRLHFERPFHMDPGIENPLADVASLNSRIEPIILRHLEQWYYLDDSIGPIE